MKELYGILAVACSAYWMVSFYNMKFKGRISHSILLPKGTNPDNCRNKEQYIKEMLLPMGGMGVLLLVYGAVELFHAFTGQGGRLLGIMLVLCMVGLGAFTICLGKTNRKYF